MTLQKGTIVLGLAKQSAKGTIATNPTFAFGVESGGLKVEPEHEALDLTAGSRARYGSTRDKVAEGAAYKTAAYPGSVGEALMALFGSVATTGTGPYTHVYSLGDTLPWYTFFEKVASDIFAITDNKVKSVEFSWEENKPLMVALEADGLTFSKPASFTPTTDEVGSVAYLLPVGGTFKYDVDSATPATASVKGGSIKFINGNDDPDFYSGSVEAGDIAEGDHTAEIALTIRPASLDEWREIVTGSASGESVAAGKVTGSFEITFVQGTSSLKFEGANVDFMYGGFVEADGKMGAWETDLAGICYMPSASSAPIVPTLVNDIASY